MNVLLTRTPDVCRRREVGLIAIASPLRTRRINTHHGLWLRGVGGRASPRSCSVPSHDYRTQGE